MVKGISKPGPSGLLSLAPLHHPMSALDSMGLRLANGGPEKAAAVRLSDERGSIPRYDTNTSGKRATAYLLSVLGSSAVLVPASSAGPTLFRWASRRSVVMPKPTLDSP